MFFDMLRMMRLSQRMSEYIAMRKRVGGVCDKRDERK